MTTSLFPYDSWPLSLLHQYPHAHITASDVSLSQIPSPEWLPPGLDVREWDFYTPIPKHWGGQFDVVHIRLALLAIKSNDTRTVLKSAWAMLKPGRWMQWDELDPESVHTIVAEGAGVDEEEVERFQRMQEMTDFKGLEWVRGLEGGFEDAGFEEVGKEVFGGEKSMVGFFQSLQFLVMEEEGGRRGEEAREGLRRNVECGGGELCKGRTESCDGNRWGREKVGKMADGLYWMARWHIEDGRWPCRIHFFSADLVKWGDAIIHRSKILQ